MSASMMSRRDVLSGRLGGDGTSRQNHLASLVVHARPDYEDTARRAIEALEGAEIHAQDAGRFVVTLETSSEDCIVGALAALQSDPVVMSAALVFHHVETDGVSHGPVAP